MKLFALLMLMLGLVMTGRSAAADLDVKAPWPERVFVFYYDPQGAPHGFHEDEIIDAVERWNGLARIEVRYGGQVHANFDDGDGLNLLAWGDYYPYGSQGVAVRIPVECDILLNSHDNGYRIDFRKAIVHEVGHCLGLAHTDECASVMNYPCWYQHPYPTEFDRRNLIALYGLPHRTVVGGLSR